MSRSYKIIVPVRPGDSDQFQVPEDLAVTTLVECADGNLSQAWERGFNTVGGDVVVFKHDDFSIRKPDDFLAHIDIVLDHYPVVGVAGSRAYHPQHHPAWWVQAPHTADMYNGPNRGFVMHPTGQARHGETTFGFTYFGGPGPVVVLDGCCIAVRRSVVDAYLETMKTSPWDHEFTTHFYDIAFTLNMSNFMLEHNNQPACYAVLTDVAHMSRGEIKPAWHVAANRFLGRYKGRWL